MTEPAAALDRLRVALQSASNVDAVAESFSVFVWDALRKDLDGARLRALLWRGSLSDSPANGGTYEHQLRAQLDQHRIARECASWARKNLQVRELTRRARDTWVSTGAPTPAAIHGAGLDAESLGLVATDDLHFPQEISDPAQVAELATQFERLWSDRSVSVDVHSEFLERIEALYRDNTPDDVYLRVLTTLFEDFLDETGDDTRARRNTGFFDSVVWSMLYKFQRDGVLGAIEKLERHGGCIIADSVGLGKTFEALAVIKYYELRNDRVLVLAPKRLRENWTMYRANEKRNPLLADRLNYDVLNHTDLSREQGYSGDIDLAHLNWENYDLVVIDESHNFRNNPQVKDHRTRYSRLMEDVFQTGVKTKVLMLSATPVNTRLADLKNQVLFATEGDDRALAAHGIDSIEGTLRRAQVRFNDWQREPDARSTKSLVGSLGMDYIRLLDLVTIARSRRHIEKYYDDPAVGQFPTRLAPINLKPPIDSTDRLVPLEEINRQILLLNLASYTPITYVADRYQEYYAALYDHLVTGKGEQRWKQSDRENNVVHLLRVGLLKRLESSVNSLAMTLEKVLGRVEVALARIEAFDTRGMLDDAESIDAADDGAFTDLDDADLDDAIEAGNVRVQLKHIDRRRWHQDLDEDRHTLSTLLAEVRAVDPSRDAKLAELQAYLSMKVTDARRGSGNPKALVFTAFADTAEYLYEHLAPWAQTTLGIDVALVTGQRTRSTLALPRIDMLNVLSAFSPRSKGGELDAPQIDLVIATDAISEGQNLQDCDTVVNYDIHWNPVRIVQRFGRVDRLGSANTEVQLVNFWPRLDLEAYINLERRVSSRMALLDVSATGEENLIDPATAAAMNDLDFRRRQLETMQTAAPTMEDLAGGLSITDLTLSDFRQDAAARPRAQLDDIANWPLALFGVSRLDATLEADGIKPGAVFLLKSRTSRLEFAEQYPLAPFILAYVYDDGEVAHPVFEPKLALDVLRAHAGSVTTPDDDAIGAFNAATRHGRSMGHYRDLLAAAVKAASGKSDENALASLFTAGPSTVGLAQGTAGLDDVELIAWLAIVP